MGKVLKWIGIAVGSLLGLLVVVVVILLIIGGVKWNQEYQNYEVLADKVAIPMDDVSISRGKHIATTNYCGFCHGQDLSGEPLINEPAMAVVYAPNLTPGKGGIGGSNTDEDWVRALRHGVGNDGRGLIAMPSRSWSYLSDEDLGALIAYLKTLPPVDNEFPTRSVGPMGRLLTAVNQFPRNEAVIIDQQTTRLVVPEPGVSVAYGEYLAQTSCSICHGVAMNGGFVRGWDGELELVLNLTPGGELASWSEDDFTKTMRSGVTPNGRQLSDSMPWTYLGQMTDDELKAVWLYLRSLPAMEQGSERVDQ
jgi:mono/diheme cytochrome c family protein